MRPVDAVLARLAAVKRTSDGKWIARCPSHDDRTPSLSVSEGIDGNALVHCFAGCEPSAIVAAVGMTMADLMGGDGARIPTVGDLAAARRLPLGALQSFGLTDTPMGVRVPYRDEAGAELYAKTRTKLQGPQHYVSDRGITLAPYGLWRLGEARRIKAITLVEGESDCWTLWHHGLPALGIPGSTSLGTLKREHLAGIERVYIVRERDEAGEKFAREASAKVKAFGATPYVLDVDAKDTSELYLRNPASFRADFRALCERARSGEARETWTAADLARTEFPPLRFVVDEILPEGLGVFVAPPKLGKSRLATAILLAVCNGAPALGHLGTHKCDALYLDFEAEPRAIKERSLAVIGPGGVMPAGATFATRWPKSDQGGLERLRTHLREHTETRLVIVDTLALFWPAAEKRTNGNAYQREYDVMADMRVLADEHHCALLLIHHDAKAQTPDDVTKSASGTRAITGAASTLWFLKRGRGKGDAELYVTGREIREQTLPLYFDAYAGTWIKSERVPL